MKVLTDPPPLFAGIKLGVTTKGVTWTTILTARLIAGEGGMVAIGCGEGENFGPLERGSNLQGALSALFSKMWDHPPLSDLAQDRDRFLLIAHSVKATYDHMARKMELMARLIISKENKRVLVKYNCGDSQQYLEKHPGAAPSSSYACGITHVATPELRRTVAPPPNLAPQIERAAAAEWLGARSLAAGPVAGLIPARVRCRNSTQLLVIRLRGGIPGRGGCLLLVRRGRALRAMNLSRCWWRIQEWGGAQVRRLRRRGLGYGKHELWWGSCRLNGGCGGI